MHSSTIIAAAVLATAAVAQSTTNTTNGGCAPGFFPGTDTVIYISPYNYSQIMSVIGSFRNLTWSGSPYNTVTLNGTDNTVGTARTYNIDGAHIIETLTVYEKPPNGPYNEVHVFNSAAEPALIPAANLSTYANYDGTTVVETCGGLASIFNFTINFCANNVTVGAAVLHGAHLSDAEGANKILGNMNFTSCAALMAANATASNSSMSISSSMMSSTMTSEGLAAATGASASMMNSMAIASASASEASASKASATASGASSSSAASSAARSVEFPAAFGSGVGLFWIAILGASTAVGALA